MTHLATSSVIKSKVTPCMMPPHTVLEQIRHNGQAQANGDIPTTTMQQPTDASSKCDHKKRNHAPQIEPVLPPHTHQTSTTGRTRHTLRTRMFGPQEHQTQIHLPNTTKGGTSSTLNIGGSCTHTSNTPGNTSEQANKQVPSNKNL